MRPALTFSGSSSYPVNIASMWVKGVRPGVDMWTCTTRYSVFAEFIPVTDRLHLFPRYARLLL
jgi:hypothetical protein